MSQSGILATAFTTLIAPFRYLSNYRNIFRNASVKGKAALIMAVLFPGSGALFVNSYIKSILKFASFAMFTIYIAFSGYKFLIGTESFPGLNMGLYHGVAIIVVVYFWFHSLYKTMLDVEQKAYKTPDWVIKVKNRFSDKGKAYRDYRQLWKHCSVSEKFHLLSPFWFMGLYQILKKHPLKGILLFLIQAAYIFYMAFTGVFDIVDFFVLNTEFRPSTFNLVYGFVAFLLSGVFMYVYVHNIKTVTIYVKDRLYKIKPMIAELKELVDHRLYVTLLTAPLLGVLTFTVVPLLFMISIAFTGYQGASLNFNWTGLDSFGSLVLVRDNLATLLSVIRWTLIWAFFATFTNYFGGILLAALINKKLIKWKKVWRTIFIITMATPQFVSLLIMYQMFGTQGPVNQTLLNLGIIDQGINFWGIQWQARTLVIIINMWIGIPYLMVLTSGILMNIPKDLYEAATVDGASRTQQFFKITMPYMLYVTAPLLVTGFISNINNFNVIYLLTQGRPYGVGLVNAGGTDILITWLYQLTRTHRMYNLSAAIGIIIFLMSAVISLGIYRNTAAYKREGELR
jgi:arabinogalactan oligomer/maltooligosaccharide transport system permease protein